MTGESVEATDNKESLQFQPICPEDIRKRARASRSSSLSTSLLAGKLTSTQSLSCCGENNAADLSIKRHLVAQKADRSSENPTISEDQEAGNDEPLSPGSRPILRKARVQKRNDTSISELSKSLDDHDFVPPHMMSLPAQNFAGTELYSRPGSLYEGAGRKLRGMDAARFRRNVMRQTGFLESTAENVVH